MVKTDRKLERNGDCAPRPPPGGRGRREPVLGRVAAQPASGSRRRDHRPTAFNRWRVKDARKIRCITHGRPRILIYMTHSPSSFNHESWQQPRYAIMRALGDSLNREAFG
jgi:hypothetical protein